MKINFEFEYVKGSKQTMLFILLTLFWPYANDPTNFSFLLSRLRSFESNFSVYIPPDVTVT